MQKSLITLKVLKPRIIKLKRIAFETVIIEIVMIEIIVQAMIFNAGYRIIRSRGVIALRKQPE